MGPDGKLPLDDTWYTQQSQNNFPSFPNEVINTLNSKVPSVNWNLYDPPVIQTWPDTMVTNSGSLILSITQDPIRALPAYLMDDTGGTQQETQDTTTPLVPAAWQTPQFCQPCE